MLTLGGVPGSDDAPHLLGSLASTDLNVNLLRFTGENGIQSHVNAEVDVLIVALDGEGVLTVDGEAVTLAAGQAVIVPKGASRSIRSNGDQIAYLTCHGVRRGLMPKVRGC
jgi:quercetin dioxygenase-like cupin family protein